MTDILVATAIIAACTGFTFGAVVVYAGWARESERNDKALGFLFGRLRDLEAENRELLAVILLPETPSGTPEFDALMAREYLADVAELPEWDEPA